MSEPAAPAPSHDSLGGLRELPLVRVGEFHYEQQSLASLSASSGYAYVITIAKLIVYPKRQSRVLYIGKAEGKTEGCDWRGIVSLGERLTRTSRDEFGGLDNPEQVAALYAVRATARASGDILEKALLTAFRMVYGGKPKANDKPEGFPEVWVDSFEIMTGVSFAGLAELLKSIGENQIQGRMPSCRNTDAPADTEGMRQTGVTPQPFGRPHQGGQNGDFR